MARSLALRPAAAQTPNRATSTVSILPDLGARPMQHSPEGMTAVLFQSNSRQTLSYLQTKPAIAIKHTTRDRAVKTALRPRLESGPLPRARPSPTQPIMMRAGHDRLTQ